MRDASRKHPHSRNIQHYPQTSAWMSVRRRYFETSKLQCTSYTRSPSWFMGRSQQDDGLMTMSEEIYAGWFVKFGCPPECVNARAAFFFRADNDIQSDISICFRSCLDRRLFAMGKPGPWSCTASLHVPRKQCDRLYLAGIICLPPRNISSETACPSVISRMSSPI